MVGFILPTSTFKGLAAQDVSRNAWQEHRSLEGELTHGRTPGLKAVSKSDFQKGSAANLIALIGTVEPLGKSKQGELEENPPDSLKRAANYSFPRGRYELGGRRPLPSNWVAQETKAGPESRGEDLSEEGERSSKETSEAKVKKGKGDYPTNLELEDKYRIVLGSFKKKEWAENFYQRLSDTSGKKIVYIPQHQVYRVLYGSYNSLNEADEDYIKVLDNNRDAWMVKF